MVLLQAYTQRNLLIFVNKTVSDQCVLSWLFHSLNTIVVYRFVHSVLSICFTFHYIVVRYLYLYPTPSLFRVIAVYERVSLNVLQADVYRDVLSEFAFLQVLQGQRGHQAHLDRQDHQVCNLYRVARKSKPQSKVIIKSY